MSKDLFRKQLAGIRPYVAGKPVEEVQRELGIDVIEKLASNENQLGPSPMAVEAILEEVNSINTYPDANVTKLRTDLGKFLDIDMDRIVVGNGGEQMIDVIARTFINEGDEAIMADTTFGLYASTVILYGGVPVELPLKDYKQDLEAFVKNINDKTKLIYVCNPNNPTGIINTKEDLDYLFSKVPDDIVVVLDEAYYDFATVNPQYPNSMEILKKRPNTIILRTFSKVAGIAGVRVGYVISSLEIVSEMNKVKGTFYVNRLAQAAAIGALKDVEHVKKTVKLNYESLGVMEKYFDEKKLEYIKTNANFIFVNVNMNSKVVFQKLMEKGIIIRGGFLWKWDNWIRVSTGTVKQSEKFVKALNEVLGL